MKDVQILLVKDNEGDIILTREAWKEANIKNKISVAMLSILSAERDILNPYKNYANCFINKPVDLHRFMEVVRKIENFWISIVRLPQKN